MGWRVFGCLTGDEKLLKEIFYDAIHCLFVSLQPQPELTFSWSRFYG